ncbi:hypothetical protein SAY86_010367 [Trapa natans]|uniref:Uncharacterized protein n=1 Tax=Trapa natans TaxID=22666 RepID=A0AAN7LKF9_TRANT|nr:hypothetical protein SAY86_010367 [Trapa natans]
MGQHLGVSGRWSLVSYENHDQRLGKTLVGAGSETDARIVKCGLLPKAAV